MKKRVKDPYTSYYEKRFLYAISLLNQVELYAKKLNYVLNDGFISSERTEELVRQHKLLTELQLVAHEYSTEHEKELRELFIQEKKKKDFLEGRWEPEYY